MQWNQGKISIGNIAVLLLVFVNAIVLQEGMVSHRDWYALLIVTIPLLLISILVSRKS